MKYYDTINDGEATPLQIPEDGYSEEALSTNKRTSSMIVRALMVGTTVTVGALLLMAGPSSKMRTMHKSRNAVDGLVVVSSTATQAGDDVEACRIPPAGLAFTGLSCKNEDYCAGPGESFEEHSAMDDFETCYISENGYCWSHSHRVTTGSWFTPSSSSFYRCDPKGYNDDGAHDGYDKDDIWHVSASPSDGSCGNPCQEFKYGT